MYFIVFQVKAFKSNSRYFKGIHSDVHSGMSSWSSWSGILVISRDFKRFQWISSDLKGFQKFSIIYKINACINTSMSII